MHLNNYYLILLIVVIGFIIYSDAEAYGETRYKNYSVVANSDEVYTSTFGLPEYVLDVDGIWKPHIIKQNANSIYVINEQFPIRFDKTTGLIDVYEKPNGSLDGIIYNAEFVKPDVFYTDKWSIAYNTGSGWVPVMNPESFQTTYNSNVIDGGYELTVNRSHPKGTISTTYQLIDGKYSKPTSSFTNDPINGFTNTKVAPINIMSNINLSNVFIENSNVYASLQNMEVDQTSTWTKNQLSKKSFELQTIGGNTFLADLDLGYDDLLAVQIIKRSNGNFDIVIAFNSVSNIALGETVTIDPTFGYSTGSYVGNIYTVNHTTSSGGPCTSSLSGIQTGTFYMGYNPTYTLTEECRYGFAEFIISSIPSDADIISVKIRTDISIYASDGNNCDWISLNTNRPSLATASTIYTDLFANSVYINASNECMAPASTDVIFDLGSQSVTDMQTAIDTGRIWFAVGAKNDLNTRDNLRRGSFTASSNVEMQVVYSVPEKFYVNLDVANVGDAVKVSGEIIITQSNLLLNVTGLNYYVNGTLTESDPTDYNYTSYPVSIDFGPFWYYQSTNDIYNHTISVTTQDSSFALLTNSSSSLFIREYDPDYFIAQDPAEGYVNYTFPGDYMLNVNRQTSGVVFNVECQYFTQADAFFNNLDVGVWDNQTNVLFYQGDTFGYYYAICFNDGELFTISIPQDYSNALVPGLAIFDQLGGFFGAPSIILVIIAILSLGTGRNYPIIMLIAASVTGILLALELLTLDPGLVVALIVMTGFGLFGIRKFY